jgi:murein DD-endopeptidase MepM/ murein hydrolase activator NlpD
LNLYRGPLGKDTRGAAEIIDRVALNYSISPRLLLALLEFQAGALTQAEPPLGMDPFYLGYRDSGHRSLYMQLVWAANTLNNLYYSYRAGTLTSFTHADGALERPDPWQNAATVALQVYFSTVLPVDDYAQATTGNGLALTYSYLFGDPWANQSGHIPGSLVQPALRLPFEAGKTWAYTGGPHTGYGSGQPLAAIDFAPPSVEGGCVESGEWVTAVADGVVARSEDGVLVLDLDGDADERTGWTIFYLHLLHDPSFTPGTAITAGQPLGHPSCEAGLSTGTHVHIARKYNGEWILAGGIGGVLAFNLDGWQAVAGSAEYVGTLVKTGQVVTACTCSDGSSHIQASFSP